MEVIMSASNLAYRTYLLKEDDKSYSVATYHKGHECHPSIYRNFEKFEAAKECFYRLK